MDSHTKKDRDMNTVTDWDRDRNSYWHSNWHNKRNMNRNRNMYKERCTEDIAEDLQVHLNYIYILSRHIGHI
jgi:hypothetical protein